MADDEPTNIESIDEMKARLADLTEKHGPNDGAVVELAAEIVKREKAEKKAK